MIEEDKIKFMKTALKYAEKALKKGEVAVGAIVVLDGKVISYGYNMRTKKQLATAHAEMIAIDKACKKLKSWRIPECELFVTLEPCPMCMGACLNSRIKKVYFGAYEQKGVTLTNELANANLLNHKIEIEGGICEEDCSNILKRFFSMIRQKNKR